MPLIRAQVGTETQADASAKVLLFHIPQDGSKECHMNVSRDRGLIKVSGTPVFRPAVTNLPSEVGGSITETRWDCPEGTLLKIYAQRRTGWNRLMVTAQCFIHVRQNAALREIRVAMLDKPTSRVPYGFITGLFDVLTLQQAREHFGVTVLEAFERFFDPSAIRETFEIRVVEPEKEGLPSVTLHRGVNEEGETVVVPEIRRRRKMSF